MTRTRTIRGFTLLELLVAVTITLVIAGLMLAVTSNVLNLWRRDQASHTLATTARQVFDLLEQDFQSAIYRRDTNRWLAVDLLDSPGSLANHGWLLTTGLMAPEAYTLDSALRSWVGERTTTAVIHAAASAYDRYQKSGVGAARRLFWGAP